MRRKALIKTIFDILKFIVIGVIGVAISFGVLYLYINIPQWLLEYFDFFDCLDLIELYFLELALPFGIFALFFGVRLLYLCNLESLEEGAVE